MINNEAEKHSKLKENIKMFESQKYKWQRVKLSKDGKGMGTDEND